MASFQTNYYARESRNKPTNMRYVTEMRNLKDVLPESFKDENGEIDPQSGSLHDLTAELDALEEVLKSE